MDFNNRRSGKHATKPLTLGLLGQSANCIQQTDISINYSLLRKLIYKMVSIYSWFYAIDWITFKLERTCLSIKVYVIMLSFILNRPIVLLQDGKEEVWIYAIWFWLHWLCVYLWVGIYRQLVFISHKIVQEKITCIFFNSCSIIIFYFIGLNWRELRELMVPGFFSHRLKKNLACLKADSMFIIINHFYYCAVKIFQKAALLPCVRWEQY